MRKEKIILSIFAVIALVCLGIGYAALTDTLTATATASGVSVNDTNGDGVVDENDEDIIDETVFNVQWKSAVAAKDGGERTSNQLAFTDPVIAGDKNSFTFTVSNMMLKGDTVTVTAVIENTSEYDAKIALTLPTADGVVAVTATGDGATVAAGGELEVTITLTLVETLFETDHALKTAKDYTVSFEATAQE